MWLWTCVFLSVNLEFGIFLPSKDFQCERDEFADLVEDLKHGSVIGCQRKGLTLYQKSFSGNQLVEWLQKEKGMGKYCKAADLQ